MLVHGADKAAAVSANTVRQFFEEDFPKHVEDEELDLFPRVRSRLRDRHSAPAQRILETIALLIEQHRELRVLWKNVVPSLYAIETGTGRHLDEAAVHAFVELYRVHLALEEDIMAPAYQRLLTAENLRQISAAMAARRGPC